MSYYRIIYFQNISFTVTMRELYPLSIFLKINNTIIVSKTVSAVPDVGQVLVFCKEKLLNSYEIIKALIERNDLIRMNIPPLFLPMMRPQLIKMENAFMPGFSTITWTSMKIPEFCEDVTKVLDYIEMFVKEVRDMKEARVDEVLDALSDTCLVYMPLDAIKPSEFLELNIEHRKKLGCDMVHLLKIVLNCHFNFSSRTRAEIIYNRKLCH